ncbi:hypothetical protein ACFE04_005378 [Oxalis oulophora]
MVETSNHQPPPPPGHVVAPTPGPQSLTFSRGPTWTPAEQLIELQYCIHSNPSWRVLLGYMESNLQSSPREDNRATKAAFRKPSSDVVNRKYRRRSPATAAGSSSPDGSPKHDGSSVQKRKDGSTELDKDAGRSQYEKSGDSHKHTDRQSSRGTHGHSRHDDYKKHDKYRDDEEKTHHMLSSRTLLGLVLCLPIKRRSFSGETKRLLLLRR